MIEDKELRIGSWVDTDHDGYIQISRGWEIDEGPEVYPIPLTKEILKLAGFEHQSWNLDPQGCIHIDVSFSENRVTIYLNDYELASVGHLHELQNLIYDLSGKEIIHTFTP